MWNSNIGIFWHRKLYMKTWYSSKFLGMLPIFLLFFWAQNSPIPPTHIYYIKKHNNLWQQISSKSKLEYQKLRAKIAFTSWAIFFLINILNCKAIMITEICSVSICAESYSCKFLQLLTLICLIC